MQSQFKVYFLCVILNLMLSYDVYCDEKVEKLKKEDNLGNHEHEIDCKEKTRDGLFHDESDKCSIKNRDESGESEDAYTNGFLSTTIPSSETKNFKTIATSKTRGRLGNHLWAYLHLMFCEYTYNIDIVVENEVKNSLTRFFKNFEALRTIDDVCGYNEFFSQYRDMIDSLIVRQYEEMSGVKVELVRSGQIVKLYPPEIGIKYGKINAESLADSKEFIKEFKVDYTKIPSTCPYKWETFRERHDVLELPEWNRNRALMMYPGNKIKIFDTISNIDTYSNENDVYNELKNFSDAFFQRLQLKDSFVKKAQKILHLIKKSHQKKHKTTKKVNDTIYIGIHSRRTDHLAHEKKHKMISVDAMYYLDAMHLYREHFRKQNKEKQLIFVFVSDDPQWGKEKLLNRVKERDLYFGGSGLPNSTDSIGVDFALLANCNHTIESHGSFSYFAGAFAGGFKVKPNHFPKYRELRHKRNGFWSKSPFKHPLPRISSF